MALCSGILLSLKLKSTNNDTSLHITGGATEERPIKKVNTNSYVSLKQILSLHFYKVIQLRKYFRCVLYVIFEP